MYVCVFVCVCAHMCVYSGRNKEVNFVKSKRKGSCLVDLNAVVQGAVGVCVFQVYKSKCAAWGNMDDVSLDVNIVMETIGVSFYYYKAERERERERERCKRDHN